jgi:hypothetical protein
VNALWVWEVAWEGKKVWRNELMMRCEGNIGSGGAYNELRMSKSDQLCQTAYKKDDFNL